MTPRPMTPRPMDLGRPRWGLILSLAGLLAFWAGAAVAVIGLVSR